MTKDEIKEAIVFWSCCGDQARAVEELLEELEETIKKEMEMGKKGEYTQEQSEKDIKRLEADQASGDERRSEAQRAVESGERQV